MPEPHLLLSFHQWNTKEPTDLIIKHTNQFGSFPFDYASLNEIQKLEKNLSDPKLRQWQRAVAEEILFSTLLDHTVPEAILCHFSETLLSTSPKIHLKDCLGKRAAMAVFPLASEDGKPSVAHAWWVEEVEAFFISATSWHGHSSGLASELAKKVAKAEGTSIINVLATQWIITGKVEKNQILSIVLENKLELRLQNRKWLIPRENLKNITLDQRNRLIIRTADSTVTAWNHITGKGSKQGKTRPWPEELAELHVLVGGNIKAQLASIFLTPKLKKVVLWHSEDKKHSEEPARQIREVCAKYRPELKIELNEIPAGDLIQAEEKLREKLRATKEEILFNVTSGNRLMSYAVQTMASLYPHIKLIYREQGEKKPHLFTLLNYSEIPPYSGKLNGIKNAHKVKCNWDFIYSSDNYSNPDEFFLKLEKSTH